MPPRDPCKLSCASKDSLLNTLASERVTGPDQAVRSAQSRLARASGALPLARCMGSTMPHGRSHLRSAPTLCAAVDGYEGATT